MGAMKSFLVALAFLTIIPIRFRELPDEATVARTRFWFPVVGLLLGLLLGSWTLGVAQITSPMIGAFLVLTVWVLITGALHLDGFCDLCDGLFGGSTAEERLRIMKEPTRGTFAVAGCVLLLLGKFVALEAILRARNPDWALFSVASAVLLARCWVLGFAAGAHYPREQGTGKTLIESISALEGACFFAIAPGMLFLWITGYAFLPPARSSNWRTVDLILSAFLMLLLMIFLALRLLRKVCERRLGGITGDCLGAGIELVELIWLLAMTAGGGP